ncbi:MAG: hypothetical protein IPP62_11095 [bacterium]|nr:hypothetical protein [bacterium]
MRKSLAKSPLSAAMPMLFLLTCLLPAAGRADDSNLLGLFYDTGGTVDQVAIDPYTQHALYLVLLNPVNDGFGGSGTRDVGSVAGFECGIVPPSGDMLLSVEFPALAINVGSTNNLIVGFASAVPVSSSRAATLATVRVMSFGNNRAGYLLSTATPQSIPGVMAYVDAEDTGDDLVGMMPVSGAFNRPVFWFGDWNVRENARWGEVKSLFR